MRGETTHRTRGILATLVVAAAAACAPAPEAEPASDSTAAAPGGVHPNIVVIVVDDLRFDEFGAAGHPFVETPNIDRLAAEGAHFASSFHAVPLCSPNRATLLTGQYPSRHGIIDNVARNLQSHRLETFPRALQTGGYETAFLGKWHMGNDPTPRPGFDYWVGLPGQGRSENPELFEDGQLHVVEGYTTDLLTDRAVAFIRRERERPFALYLAHKAVHPDISQLDDGSVDAASSRGFVPAPRHVGRYDGETFPYRPNGISSLSDLEDKPALRGALSRRTSDPVSVQDSTGWATNQRTIRRRAEMLLAVDDGLGRILDALDELGVLDETVVVLTSDNGYFYGEHGLTSERRMPYEESIRNPLLMRYPPIVEAGSRPDGLALTVDLAPTLLELAGVPIGPHVQGRSLVPLLRGDEPADWRESILVEFYTYENPFPHLVDMDYRMVRTDRYKYVHWIQHPEMTELYDLEADPYEVENRADDPALTGVRSELRAELGRLLVQATGVTAVSR